MACCTGTMPAFCIASCTFFFFNDTATTEIYTLSLHDALPISLRSLARQRRAAMAQWLELADDAPHTLRLVMQRLRSGRLQADLDIRHIDRLSLALEIGRASCRERG